MLENVIQIKSEITLNANVECKNLKKHHVHKKDYIWDPTHAVVKMVIPYDEILEERKAIPTNFNEKKQPAK